MSTKNKAFSIILVVLIIATIGSIVYIVSSPPAEESFTEFYILGTEGKAKDYPMQLVVGEEGRVIIGIVNREYETVTYRAEVRIDGVRNSEIAPIVLEYGKKWEQKLSFIPQKAGKNQKVEFLLYKQGQIEAYRMLHLWVDITQ